MLNLKHKSINKIVNIVLIIAIIIATLGFLTDLRNTIKTGGVDLRNRVVGARLLHRGLDPYYYKWTPGEDEKLLDPLDTSKAPFSRVTVPPSILLLHLPLANLPYFSQRIIWLFLQWGALIGSCLFLFKKNLNYFRIKILWIAVCLFVAGNNFWRLHVGVGQIYVFYVFLLSLAYWVSQTKVKNKDILVGCLIGFTASIRLPMIVMILPMIFFKKFKLVSTTLLGLCISLTTFFVLSGSKAWVSYFSAMSTIGRMSRMNLVAQTNHTEEFVMPTIIEGMNNLTAIPTVLNANTSIQGLFKTHFNLSINGNILIIICCLILLAYVTKISLISKNRNEYCQRFEWDILFFMGTLMILIVDFFIPAPRYTYNDIQLLIPLFLFLKNINFYNIKSIVYIIFLILSLSIANGMYSWAPRSIMLLTSELITISTLILCSLDRNLLFSDSDKDKP